MLVQSCSPASRIISSKPEKYAQGTQVLRPPLSPKRTVPKNPYTTFRLLFTRGLMWIDPLTNV